MVEHIKKRVTKDLVAFLKFKNKQMIETISTNGVVLRNNSLNLLDMPIIPKK